MVAGVPENYYYPAAALSIPLSGNGMGSAISVTTNNASSMTGTYGTSPATGTVVFTNSGNQAATLTMGGLTAPYSVSPASCSVAAGGTCTVTVSMATGTAGAQPSQTLMATGGSTGVASAGVSGTVIVQNGTLALSPSALTVSASGGQTAYSATITLSNSGPGPVNGIAMSFARTLGSTGDVSLAYDTCSGTTLSVGGSCTFKIAFASDCPASSSARWNLSVTGAHAANTPVLAITGNSGGGMCI
jgi:hypothetical protein